MTSAPESPPLTPLLESDVLRTFVAIAETGSFTRAARQVFRTPSAVSMQIKRLEETLGQTLFIRDARRVRLTAEGEALLGYGRRLLKLNEEAVAQFLAPSLSGTLRFGTPDDIGTRILPGVLSRFAHSHPAIRVNVSVGQSRHLIQRLNDGELDLALVNAGNEGIDPDRGDIVHTEPLVWAGREGGIAARRSPLPLTLANQGCAWRTAALAALDDAGVDYRIAYVSENCSGQEAAMLADLAVGTLPRSLIRPPLRSLDGEAGLPTLGNYHIMLCVGAARSPIADALAGYISSAFQGYRA